jgi:hypothetical protein
MMIIPFINIKKRISIQQKQQRQQQRQENVH